MCLARLEPQFNPSGPTGYSFLEKDILVTEDTIFSDAALASQVAAHQVTTRPTTEGIPAQPPATDDAYTGSGKWNPHTAQAETEYCTPQPQTPESPRSPGINPDVSMTDPTATFTVGDDLPTDADSPRGGDGNLTAVSLTSVRCVGPAPRLVPAERSHPTGQLPGDNSDIIEIDVDPV